MESFAMRSMSIAAGAKSKCGKKKNQQTIHENIVENFKNTQKDNKNGEKLKNKNNFVNLFFYK